MARRAAVAAADAPAPAQSGCAASRLPTSRPPAAPPGAMASMRSSASTARSRISSVTCRFGHSVDAEKNPAITASKARSHSGSLAGKSVRRPTNAEMLAQLGKIPSFAPEIRTCIPAARSDKSGKSWPRSASTCRTRSAPGSRHVRPRESSGSRHAVPRVRRAPHSPARISRNCSSCWPSTSVGSRFIVPSVC